MRSSRFICLLLAPAALALGGGCDSPYGQQACRMENEAVLASMPGIPTAVSVIPNGAGGFVAAWSGYGRTWVAELDPKGFPKGAARSVALGHKLISNGSSMQQAGPKTFWPAQELSALSAEDLALVGLNGGATALAVLERSEQGRAGGAYLTVIPREVKDPLHSIRLGPAGEYASRISAARLDKGLLVAWHEGALRSSEIHLALVELDPLRVAAREKIPGNEAMSSPSLAVLEGAVLISWSKTEYQDEKPVSIVSAAQLTPDLKLKDRTVINTGYYIDSAPYLTALQDHFGLVFRDNRDEDDTAEFYFARIDREGNVILPPKRISRSDGFRGPRISGDLPVFSATIRSFQRNLLIGLNRFNLKGVKHGGEFQVYADKSNFIRVSIAASGNKALLVYGEDKEGKGRVLAGSVICKPGS